jgi:serine protease AprX
MTASHRSRPGAAPPAGSLGTPVPGALPRGARRAGALLLAASAALPLAPAPAAADLAAPAGEATRVVVTSVAGGVSTAARAVSAVGGTVLARLPIVGGVAAELPAGADLGPAYQVVPDRPLQLAGEATAGPASTVRATLGLPASGSEGAGVTVAVVDTGVADHPDLAGRLAHVDVTGEGGGDGYGHGTFIAGLVAGSGASSGGAVVGVAPRARVLDVKVARADGSTDLVTVLRGLQVAARADVDVLNLSLSSGSELPYQLDPLNTALRRLWRSGTTVVVPSGNDGTTVSAPGNDPVLLTVGGLDEGRTADRSDDGVASWSGRGPAAQGVAKPDLVAPGASVVSLRAAGSVVDAANPQARVGNGYFRGSGTSFSTAVTSGAVAALLAERRLTPDQVKAVVTGTAYDAAGLAPATAAGAGGLDVGAALDAKAPSVGQAGKANAVAGDVAPGSVPGDPETWAELLRALAAQDRSAAASSWGALSPAARNWAARTWAELAPSARDWAARNWAVEGWDEVWVARNWAARNWAASSWAASSWAARNWSARNWSDEEWAARNWSARNWSARNWSAAGWDEEWADAWDARNWSARNWSARNWTARNWTAAEWSARNWLADGWSQDDEWSARNWTARNWTARNWTARNWTAVDWA